jgi:hypothetical protein
MSGGKIKGLAGALSLSHDMLSAAEKGDLQTLESLDLQRMELLQFFRSSTTRVAAADQALLQQIAEMNARTIGMLEHQRRSKGRDLEMAAVGRRAVAAYSGTRSQR